MVKLVQKIIESKRDHDGGNFSTTVPKDVIDVLLNSTTTSDHQQYLTDDLIADNMIDMMIPGEDSVPVLMTLAIKFLSDCPAALQQLTVCTPFFLEIFSRKITSKYYIRLRLFF